MSIKKITAIMILCTISTCFQGFTLSKTIVVMPFQNNGALRYDKLSDYIASYLILLFKDIPGYTIVPLYELKSYMTKMGYHHNDLKKQDVVKQIAGYFDIDYCIGGYFNDESRTLLIAYKIYRYAHGDLTLKEENISIELQNHDILTLNKNFDRIIRITEETTKMETESGILTVITDHECSMYIDGNSYGKTPLRFRLGVGEHRLMLIHEGNHAEVILEKNIYIKKEASVVYNIPVFVPLTITAEKKCCVSLNGEEKGTTPYTTNLYSGREYLIEVTYYGEGGKKTVVYHEIVSTHNAPLEYYFPAKGSIHIDVSPAFQCRINGVPVKNTPYSFTDLSPGTYTLQVLLPDSDTKRKWIFYNEKCTLSPFENIHRNLETFNYTFNWGLTLIPSAAQFYNREPLKGGIVLGIFAGSMVLTGISFYFNNYYAQRYDELMQKGYESDYGDSGELAKKLNETAFMKDLFSYLLTGGIVLDCLVFIYSAIDGYITMDHIYHLIYQ